MTLPASGPLAMTDIQTEFGGTNPIGLNEYYAGGGLVPPGTSGTYGAVPSSGALSIQNFYGTSNYIPVYIEELFSTYLYTGNGSTQTITNGIDLAGEGGLVWGKSRSAFNDHFLINTVSGASNGLSSNLTSGNSFDPNRLTAFTASGFSVGTSGSLNTNATTYASWTFRKQPKFFDIVTYTGNGTELRQIAHNLGAVPGFIVVKRTDSSSAGDGSSWAVWHRSASGSGYLNRTYALDSSFPNSIFWGGSSYVAPTSTNFTVSTAQQVNESGGTYIAYLFAHNAGGFGLTGTDNVISCGSFTTDGSANSSTTLGWEPQWVLVKSSSATGGWFMFDNMRGMPVSGDNNWLYANLANAEVSSSVACRPNATGFTTFNLSVNTTHIYIAIRRGPMKVPTLGTSVFAPIAANNALGTENTTGFPLDMQIQYVKSGSGNNGVVASRLTNVSSNTTSSGSYLRTPSNNAEETGSDITRYWGNTGFQTASNWAGSGMIYWNFRRAPGFFDVVCYTGTGSAQSLTHNLGVAPEFILIKNRTTGATPWIQAANFTPTTYQYAIPLDGTTDNGFNVAYNYLIPSAPTASQLNISGQIYINQSGSNYVVYLFASAPGVSKVGSYTGTGATQTINCGFTGGARFVLIKRATTGGSIFVWDSARGILAGNDPYLLLNSTAAEVTNTDWVNTAASGFELSNAGGNLANSNGVSYIFLAVA